MDDRTYRRKHESSVSRSCASLAMREDRVDEMQRVSVDDRNPRALVLAVRGADQVLDEILAAQIARPLTINAVDNEPAAVVPSLVFVLFFFYVSHRRSHLHLQSALAS